MLPLVQGVILGASICSSIGPQTLFVLRQGIYGQAALTVALIFTVIDVAMIAVAIAGTETVVTRFPEMEQLASWGAGIFIFAYACVSLATAARPSARATIDMKAQVFGASAAIIAMTLALSLLNPQAYIEMMVMVGVVGLNFPSSERWLFGIGVALVSPLWFFGLVLIGRRAGPLLARPGIFRIFDMIAGLAMMILALVILGGDVT